MGGIVSAECCLRHRTLGLGQVCTSRESGFEKSSSLQTRCVDWLRVVSASMPLRNMSNVAYEQPRWIDFLLLHDHETYPREGHDPSVAYTP